MLMNSEDAHGTRGTEDQAIVVILSVLPMVILQSTMSTREGSKGITAIDSVTIAIRHLKKSMEYNKKASTVILLATMVAWFSTMKIL